MIINKQTKQKILNRQLTLGTWVQTGSSVVAEILRNVGFEWIAADMEHTDIDEYVFSNFVRSLSEDCTPFARVRSNDTLAIRKVLDCGAGGVIVPLVNTRDDAIKAVRASKYPPIGERGFAFCKANKWGFEFEEYTKYANNDIAVIVMIESKQAVENIDLILEVEGVDGVFIGPYDMSGSYGIVGQIDSLIIDSACKKVAEACEKYKKAAGLHIVMPTEAQIERALVNGFSFIALGMDTVFVDSYARSVIKMMKMIERYIRQ